MRSLQSQPISKNNPFDFFKTGLILAYLFLLPFVGFSWSSFIFAESKEAFPKVALVLGAGIQNQLPSKVLQERLDVAINLYQNNQIKYILVSGSNQDFDYNEPEVMKNYLLKNKVLAKDVFQDFGGRRTMDSCWRAKHVFKIDSVVLISQAFHLPRSEFLCKSVGLKTRIALADDSSQSTLVFGLAREVPASWLAIKDSWSYQPEIGADGNEPDFSKI